MNNFWERKMKKKTTVWLTILYALGIIIGYKVILPLELLFFVIIGCILVLAFLSYRGKVSSKIICLLVIAMGILAMNTKLFLISKDVKLFNDNYLRIDGIVRKVEKEKNGESSYIVDVKRVHDLNRVIHVNSRVKMFCKKSLCDKFLFPGDRIKAYGKAFLPKRQTNPWGFDYRKYLEGQGISAVFYAYDLKKEKAIDPRLVFARIMARFKAKMENNIELTLSKPYSSLLKGLLLGTKKQIEPEIFEDFNRVGMVHILAVSGLHVGYVLLATLYILRKFAAKESIKLIAAAVVLLMFIVVTGSNPPVIRAGLMAFIALAGKLLGRERDMVNALFFTVMVMLIINPFYLFMASFQLSIAAVLGILFLYPRLKNKLNFLPHEKLSDLFCVTLAAQMGVLPLTVYYFNQVSLISPVANLLIIPLAGVCVILGFLSAIFLVWLPPAAVINKINGVFLWGVLKISNLFASLPYTTLSLPSPSVFNILCYYVVMVLFFGLIPSKSIKIDKKKVFIFVVIFVAVVNLVVIFKGSNVLQVIFFDVGQGDAVLIRTPDNRTALIDTGMFESGKYVIHRFLKKEGIKKIDLVVVTHFHEDHCGGLLYLIDHLDIERIIVSPGNVCTELFQQLIEKVKQTSTHVLALSRGDRFWLGDVCFHVLHPSPDFKPMDDSDLNDSSIVLKMNYKQVDFLFTGDVENRGETEIIMENLPLKADVIKIAHHGAATSNSFDFLKAVDASYAIISVGEYNRFGHPHIRVLKDLSQLNTQIYRTDKNGAVEVTTDGREIKIKPYLNRERLYGLF